MTSDFVPETVQHMKSAKTVLVIQAGAASTKLSALVRDLKDGGRIGKSHYRNQEGKDC